MHLRTERNRVGAEGFRCLSVVVIGIWICYGVGVAHGIRVSKGTAELVSQKEGEEGPRRATAVFAMGSFWRGEAVFGCLQGVLKTRVGYCGGTKLNPDYHNIGDQAECVEVEYDSSTIRYEQLLDVFWSNHDPTQNFGQGPDVGDQYRSVILTQSEDEGVLAIVSKEREQIKVGGSTVVTTKVLPLSGFYVAAAEHQTAPIVPRANLQSLQQLPLNIVYLPWRGLHYTSQHSDLARTGLGSRSGALPAFRSSAEKKFELKRKMTLFQFFGDWSEDQLITSTTAAKLNSYAAGFCGKSVKKLIDAKVSPLLKSRPQLLKIFGN